jgi:lysozyme
MVIEAAALARLHAQLELHEGRRARTYQDSVGILTGGVGRNLIAVPFADDEIDLMRDNDITRACAWLDAHAPWWRAKDTIRQRVLIDMAFNLGNRLAGFEKFLDALRRDDYATAVREMQQSRWATQVGARATRLEQMVLTGADYTT